MAEIDFHAEDYDPRGGFAAMPDGEYRVQVVATEIKPNSKNTGDLLELELEVLEGEYKGQRCWDHLNINNRSEKASLIARGRLSRLCYCTGQLHLRDTDKLRFIPVIATLTYRPERFENGRNFGPSNAVSTYNADPDSGVAIELPDAGHAPEREPEPEQRGRSRTQDQAPGRGREREREREPERARVATGQGDVGRSENSSAMPWRRARSG